MDCDKLRRADHRDNLRRICALKRVERSIDRGADHRRSRHPAFVALPMIRACSYIEADRGQGAVQIAATVGSTSTELAYVFRSLLDEERITSKGSKRKTRYSLAETPAIASTRGAIAASSTEVTGWALRGRVTDERQNQ